MDTSLAVGEAPASQEERHDAPSRVTFQVTALYGLSTESVAIPLNETETIESGQVCVTIDPDANTAGNIGVIDYERGRLDVRYAGQIVFPGLYKLVRQGGYEPSLLNPVRVTATDRCTLLPDLSGWHAVGCLQFLPGSLWAGAKGG